MEDTRKGLTINNRFTLEEYKGSGTFGEVWRAKDNQKKKNIAIKIYISLNRQGCDEFLEEYKIASGLVHKNLLVTEQYDVWQSRPYLTMKYCAKGSAANLVGKLKPTMENERLLWSFIRDVSAGLAYLHNLEPDPIVHQDIKPDNVLIDSDGTFMITDFGISKKVRNTLRSQSKRAVEAGATAYMGPERFSKQPAPILASDIWSLGASIYELAEGELPFSGMGGIMLKNGAEMPDLEGWSDDLNNIMHQCLEKEPWKRAKAHEIEKIAAEKVSYYDDHLRDYPDEPSFDPRATQRQTSSSTSNGTVKKEPPKQEPPKAEPTSLKGLWYFLAAIAACLILYFGFFHESTELKDAKLHNEAYTTLVSQCSQSTEQGDGNNTQALLNAKQAYSKIVELEKEYASIQPDFYNKSSELKDPLDSKLSEAANAWAEAAKMQVENLGDYSKAIEFYKLASSLWGSESIKKSFKQTKEATAYTLIKDCKFANESNESKVLTGFGKTLYASQMRYLTPKIIYDGLEGDNEAVAGYEFLIKLIRPDGTLDRGSSSPKGYTFSCFFSKRTGENLEQELTGWGNSTESTYSAGTYGFEIWFNKKKIYSTTVELK